LQVQVLSHLPKRVEDKVANKFFGFFSEAKQELNKVVWPTRHELLANAGVVITTTLILAAFIGVVDFILSQVIQRII
jgi:preprotein translocase subunit SecE